MTFVLAAYRVATRALAPIYLWRANRGLSAVQQAERSGVHSIPQQGVIWCQAPSLGELDALAPLLPALHGAGEVLVTTQSTTGAQKAAQLSPRTALAPVDTPAAVAQFIDTWRPRLAVFVESDLPANMMQALAQRGIPFAVIAARSSKTRRRFPRSVAQLLSRATVITASTDAVARELRDMGLHVQAVEDLKAQGAHVSIRPHWAAELADRPVWLAASTHPEDRDCVFAAHDVLLQRHPNALLLIAPRHPDADGSWVPDRFEAGFFSRAQWPTAQTQVFVVDALGQMGGLHAVAHVTYLGGGMSTRGGHSPWEAASAGNYILTGPDTRNNAAAFAQINHETVDTAQSLARAVQESWDKAPPAAVNAPTSTATRDALLAVLGR
jgi:3-deoxy-D-manno-octulosonic-acid transferase